MGYSNPHVMASSPFPAHQHQIQHPLRASSRPPDPSPTRSADLTLVHTRAKGSFELLQQKQAEAHAHTQAGFRASLGLRDSSLGRPSTSGIVPREPEPTPTTAAGTQPGVPRGSAMGRGMSSPPTSKPPPHDLGNVSNLQQSVSAHPSPQQQFLQNQIRATVGAAPYVQQQLLRAARTSSPLTQNHRLTLAAAAHPPFWRRTTNMAPTNDSDAQASVSPLGSTQQGLSPLRGNNHQVQVFQASMPHGTVGPLPRGGISTDGVPNTQQYPATRSIAAEARPHQLPFGRATFGSTAIANAPTVGISLGPRYGSPFPRLSVSPIPRPRVPATRLKQSSLSPMRGPNMGTSMRMDTTNQQQQHQHASGETTVPVQLRSPLFLPTSDIINDHHPNAGPTLRPSKSTTALLGGSTSESGHAPNGQHGSGEENSMSTGAAPSMSQSEPREGRTLRPSKSTTSLLAPQHRWTDGHRIAHNLSPQPNAQNLSAINALAAFSPQSGLRIGPSTALPPQPRAWQFRQRPPATAATSLASVLRPRTSDGAAASTMISPFAQKMSHQPEDTSSVLLNSAPVPGPPYGGNQKMPQPSVTSSTETQQLNAPNPSTQALQSSYNGGDPPNLDPFFSNNQVMVRGELVLAPYESNRTAARHVSAHGTPHGIPANSQLLLGNHPHPLRVAPRKNDALPPPPPTR